MKNVIVHIVLLTTALPIRAAGKRVALEGAWIIVSAQIGNFQHTLEGVKKRAANDFQKDDPDYQCKPASITRVMHTPSPPIEIRQRQDRVEMNYEFMDIHRRVPLKQGLAAKDAPFAVSNYPHLGKSVGQYDGETLVVEI